MEKNTQEPGETTASGLREEHRGAGGSITCTEVVLAAHDVPKSEGTLCSSLFSLSPVLIFLPKKKTDKCLHSGIFSVG